MYTLEQLNDLEQIRDLRRKYSHFYDGQDIDGLCTLFAEGAVCRWDAKHGGSWHGKEAIRHKYLEYFAKYPGYFSVLHAVTNHVVTLKSHREASGRCFLLDYNFLKTERPSPLGTVGVYDDVYVKEDGVWKFQKVSLDFLWPQRAILNPPEISYQCLETDYPFDIAGNR